MSIVFFAFCIALCGDQIFPFLPFEDPFKRAPCQSVAMEPPGCNFEQQLIITACQWLYFDCKRGQIDVVHTVYTVGGADLRDLAR